MKKSGNIHGFRVCYYTGSIIALVLLLHGCSGVTKTVPPVTTMTTETVEVVKEGVENPGTKESFTKKSGQHHSSDSLDYLLITTACLLIVLVLYRYN